jgi:hypothetical protein
VRPSIKLTDDLVERQVGSEDCTDNCIRGHAGDTDVCSAALAMLGGVFGTNGVIDHFRSERRVDHDGLTSEGRLDLLQELSQSLKVGFFGVIRRVVQ